jgi:hypothetical protein
VRLGLRGTIETEAKHLFGSYKSPFSLIQLTTKTLIPGLKDTDVWLGE